MKLRTAAGLFFLFCAGVGHGRLLAQEEKASKSSRQADVFPRRLDKTPLHVWKDGRDVGEIPRELPGGSEEKAIAYYGDLALQLDLPGDEPPATLDALFDYFGYLALTPKDVDELGAKELTDYAGLRERYRDAPRPHEFLEEKAAWDVLVAGYFAPKTSDVSGLSNKVSWRKAVRLKARKDSPAEKNGLDALYFLSVVYVERGHQGNPFEEPSVNIQVMLTRDLDRADEDGAPIRGFPAYWLLFDPRHDYKLAHYTETSWDAADPALTMNNGEKQYFVPDACQQCHGLAPETATLHFFDTDYTLDRIQPGDDFHDSVGAGRWAALFDCGKDPETEQFRRGFAMFRRLNEEILAHNQAAGGVLQTAGAANWLRLHADSDRHAPPIKRGWQAENAWSDDKKVDRELLPLLNRYCYRCHGTIAYSVYDKATVVGQTDWMLMRLTATDLDERMPIDRDLPKNDAAGYNALKKWLEELTKQ